MTKIFLDANVVLDTLVPGRPFGAFSRKILTLSDEDTRICISSLTVATSHYVAKKILPADQVISFLKRALDKWKILPVGDMDVYDAVRSACPDFEDALQISCAEGACDVIVTADKKHFAPFTALPVFTPEEFLEQLRLHSEG